MSLAHDDGFTIVECQRCWALWTVGRSGVPPSQDVCGHDERDLLMRNFEATSPAEPFRIDEK